MADNTTVDNGSLTDYVVSTDEGAGGHVQRVKLAYSADGSETHVPADANGLDVDVTAVIPGTGAANLGKAEDATHSSGDVGVMSLAVRNDVLASRTNTDGDYSPLSTKASGALYTGSDWLNVTGSASSAAVLTNFPVDCNSFRFVSVQLSGAWTATISFECSNDFTTWSLMGMWASTSAISYTSQVTTNGQFYGPVNGRFFRVRVSSYTSGTVDATVAFSSTQGFPSGLSVVSTTSHDGPLSTQQPFVIAGVASAAAPSDVSADQDAVRSWHLRNGSQVVNLAAGGTLITGDGTNGLDVDVTRLPTDVALADNAGFTDGTTKVLPHGFIYDEVAGTALSENDVAAARINLNRAQVGIIEDGATRGRWATVTASNAVKVDGSGVTQPVSGTVTASNTAGDVAHSSTDSGNPVKIGHKAIAHGTNPTAVDANERTDSYANRAGIPFVIGGHPNVISTEYMTTGAQTDDAIITISTGSKIVVTEIEVLVSNATTVDVKCRIGFGTANVPTEPTTGNSVNGVVLAHPKIAPGSGVVRGSGAGILAIGADNEDLRITCDAPTSGQIQVLCSYYTIES